MSCPLKSKIDVWSLKKNRFEDCRQEEIQKSKLTDTLMAKVQCTLGKVIVNLNEKLKVMNKDEQNIEKTFCHICDEDHREEYITHKFNKEFNFDERFRVLMREQGVYCEEKERIIRISDTDKDNHVFLEVPDNKEEKVVEEVLRSEKNTPKKGKKIQPYRERLLPDQDMDERDIGSLTEPKEREIRNETSSLLVYKNVRIKVMTYKRDTKFSELTQMRLIIHQATEHYWCFVFAIISQDDQIYDEQSPYSEQRSLLKKSYFFILKTQEQMQEIFASSLTDDPIPIVREEDEI
jgi:hypothetical protein